MKARLMATSARSLTEPVIDLDLPPFDEPPAVILWGDRVFQYRGHALTADIADYLEVFAYAVPPDVNQHDPRR